MKNNLVFALLAVAPLSLAPAQPTTPTLARAEYQIDCNPPVAMVPIPGSEMVVPDPSGMNPWSYVRENFDAQIDTSDLSIGIHFLSVRVNDGTLWSHDWLAGCEADIADHRNTRILRVEGPQHIAGVEYFVGERNRIYTPEEISAFQGIQVAAPIDGAWNDETETARYTVDTTNMEPGSYSIFTRIKDQDNLWSSWRESVVAVDPPLELQTAEWTLDPNSPPGTGNPVELGPPDVNGDYALHIPNLNLYNLDVFPAGQKPVIYIRAQNNQNFHHTYTPTSATPPNADRGKWSATAASRVEIDRCPYVSSISFPEGTYTYNFGTVRPFTTIVKDDDGDTDYTITYLVNGEVAQTGQASTFRYTVGNGSAEVKMVLNSPSGDCEDSRTWIINGPAVTTVATPSPTTPVGTQTPSPTNTPVITTPPPPTTIVPTTVATTTAPTSVPTTAPPTTTVPPTTTASPTATPEPTRPPIPGGLIVPLESFTEDNWKPVTLPTVFAEPELKVVTRSLSLITTAPNAFGYFETRVPIGPFADGLYKLTANVAPTGPIATGELFPEIRLRVTGNEGLVNHVRADASTGSDPASRDVTLFFESPNDASFGVSVDILRFIQGQTGGYVVTGFEMESWPGNRSALPDIYTGALQIVESNWTASTFPDVFSEPTLVNADGQLTISTTQGNSFGYWSTANRIGPLTPGVYELRTEVVPDGSLEPGEIYPEVRLRVTSADGLVNVFRADATTGSNTQTRSISVFFESTPENNHFAVAIDILRFLESQRGGYRVNSLRVFRNN